MRVAEALKLWIFPKGGTERRQVPSALFIVGKGIEGDRHFGQEEKQVSLLTEKAAAWRDSQDSPGICSEKFKENVLLKSVKAKYEPGDLLGLGEAAVTIDGRKGCYAQCPHHNRKAMCPMQEGGYFASVAKTGNVAAFDAPPEAKAPAPAE